MLHKQAWMKKDEKRREEMNMKVSITEIVDLGDKAEEEQEGFCDLQKFKIVERATCTDEDQEAGSVTKKQTIYKC